MFDPFGVVGCSGPIMWGCEANFHPSPQPYSCFARKLRRSFKVVVMDYTKAFGTPEEFNRWKVKSGRMPDIQRLDQAPTGVGVTSRISRYSFYL